MKIDYDFGEMLIPGHYLIVPIVLGEAYGDQAGTIKHLHVHPGKRHPGLLDVKFEKSAGSKNKHRLRRLELLESQLDAGCFLLLEEFDNDNFPEGRKEYEKWMEGTRPRRLSSGKKVAPSRGKPFPERLLPLRVRELRRLAGTKVKEAQVDPKLVHPADRKK